jgi:hypothetical protein
MCSKTFNFKNTTDLLIIALHDYIFVFGLSMHVKASEGRRFNYRVHDCRRLHSTLNAQKGVEVGLPFFIHLDILIPKILNQFHILDARRHISPLTVFPNFPLYAG